ncbi:chaplin family protein [Nonomuraea basaltis]|uniref:chaplin family protein n=1 Tax=Nonomuraea basaltis TaxID=2495887 RepID=UPI00110C5F35|nr:chaplin family protein [Nonomuraea basaltis]TMR93738.1 chaplin [Nonomuraea basaltis]
MPKKTLVVAGAAAMLAMAAPIAHADVTSGNGGVIAGNQLRLPIGIPVHACGNAVAGIGISVAGCKGGALQNVPGHH